MLLSVTKQWLLTGKEDADIEIKTNKYETNKILGRYI